MGTLLLRLAGPMQSWGSSSLFDRRDTDYYPTKSGVIGMLAAALGRKRGDALDDLRQLRFGVRIDAPGKRIDDFQITEMIDENVSYKSNVSHRFYLSDAIFLVGLECEDRDKLQEIMYALMHPVYAVFLGRRSCPPAGPLVLGIRESGLADALRDSDWMLPEWRQKTVFYKSDTVFLRILIEDSAARTLVRDNPVSFSPYRRQYLYRGIRECSPKVIAAPQKAEHMDIYTTDIDPVGELG